MAEATGDLPVNPKAEAVSRVYADALLDAAPAGQAGAVVEELASFLAEIQKAKPEFLALLGSAMISGDEKTAVLKRAVVPFVSQTLGNFLCILAEHGRLELLSQILQTAQRRHEARSGQGRVLVQSALPLSQAEQDNIRRQLAASLPFEPILELKTDPSLLGGLVLRIGDTVYDGSLRARLKQLRTRMRERSLYEIQSGRDRFSHSERD